ncbi:MAG: pectin esterase [Rikenellaceae bacterium]|jgi:pectin methylesterase-like acyl-CoA thioesterase|nr:pectin esterase [Rikenellaceae bacterium]
MKKNLLISAIAALLLGAGASPASAQFSVFPRDTIIVAQDGSGDFKTIGAAMDCVRGYRPEPSVMIVKKGVYNEKIIVFSWIQDLKIVGEGPDQTKIVWGDYNGLNQMGTFKTYTMLVQGTHITLENLTVENSAGPRGQAVALHIDGDRCTVRNCRLLGNQDTLLTGLGGTRNYFVDCYIEGTTDYIFGPSTAWFENCTLHCKRDSFITAAATPQDQKYGYVFNNCKVTVGEGVTRMCLGRPWRSYAAVLFMHCELPEAILPIGWNNWGNKANELTARYAEYKNVGPGANTSERPAWIKTLTDAEAAQATLANVLGDWDPTRE